MVCACVYYHEQPPRGWDVKSQARLDSIFDVVIHHLRSHPHIVVCLQQAAVVSCQGMLFLWPRILALSVLAGVQSAADLNTGISGGPTTCRLTVLVCVQMHMHCPCLMLYGCWHVDPSS